MDYNWVKKLKDAGYSKSSDVCTHCEYPGLDEEPTLPELIEACGSIEFIIHCYPRRHNNDITGEPWFVIERPNTNLEDMRRCSTPEEAVANLWLALQNKKS